MFKLGLIVNPYAGVGGPAALKGSDAPDAYRKAKAMGIDPAASKRVQDVFDSLMDVSDSLDIYCASGAMGADILDDSYRHQIIYQPTSVPTSGEDSYLAAMELKRMNVDLILFAGGDGTARDICRAIGDRIPVIGIPAGVKMHSGVFGVTPNAVASLVLSMLRHRLVAVIPADVRDIDESSFQQGIVRTRLYGEMLVPDDQLLVQSVKNSGVADDALSVEDICAYLEEMMEPDCLYVLGSGGTLKTLKDSLGFDGTLLGVDLFYNGECIAADVSEPILFEYIQQYSHCRMILSIIGGQGIALGRGNQQISARIIRKIGKQDIQFVSTLKKLRALDGKPLRVDTGDDELDRSLCGYHQILTGYEQFIYYEVGYISAKGTDS